MTYVKPADFIYSMVGTLRIEWPGGRYHVTARGNERKDIFWNDADRFHFLELLGELGGRLLREQLAPLQDQLCE